MYFNKKFFLIAFGGLFALIFIIVISVNLISNNSHFFRQAGNFSLTVINESDYDLVSIETGILQSNSSGNVVKGASRHRYSKVIESGRKALVSPGLISFSEGGIYMEYTDSRGKEVQKTVCSYTEGASGFSVVTILNDEVKVEENCM